MAHWKAQTYKSEQFVDLVDLCFQIKDQFPNSQSTQDACNELLGALGDPDYQQGGQQGCVLKSGCSGFEYQYSHGVSLYMPWATISASYAHLDFPNVSKWLKLLEQYIEQTRRDPRFPPPQLAPEQKMTPERMAGFKEVILHAQLDVVRSVLNLKNKKDRGIYNDIKKRLYKDLTQSINIHYQSNLDTAPLEYALERLGSKVIPKGGVGGFAKGERGGWDSARGGWHSPRGGWHGPKGGWHGPRSPLEREHAVKNFPVTFGKDFWP